MLIYMFFDFVCNFDIFPTCPCLFGAFDCKFVLNQSL